jgi:hypothetical protein
MCLYTKNAGEPDKENIVPALRESPTHSQKEDLQVPGYSTDYFLPSKNSQECCGSLKKGRQPSQLCPLLTKLQL